MPPLSPRNVRAQGTTRTSLPFGTAGSLSRSTATDVGHSTSCVLWSGITGPSSDVISCATQSPEVISTEFETSCGW